MNSCIFCKIIEGKAEASILYEDDLSLAFMDIHPINTGHILVIPRIHIASWQDMEETLGGHLFQIALKLNKAIRQSSVPCEGINYLAADGAAAFQEVFHAHLHVIPRFRGDGFRFKFPDHYPSKPSRKDLNTLANEIQSHLR